MGTFEEMSVHSSKCTPEQPRRILQLRESMCCTDMSIRLLT